MILGEGLAGSSYIGLHMSVPAIVQSGYAACLVWRMSSSETMRRDCSHKFPMHPHPALHISDRNLVGLQNRLQRQYTVAARSPSVHVVKRIVRRPSRESCTCWKTWSDESGGAAKVQRDRVLITRISRAGHLPGSPSRRKAPTQQSELDRRVHANFSIGVHSAEWAVTAKQRWLRYALLLATQLMTAAQPSNMQLEADSLGCSRIR